MKPSEIGAGKTYTNGKGLRRKVFDFVDNPTRQTTTETPTEERATRFDVLYTHEHEGAWKGRTGRMWLPYFAKWAKSEVKEGEDG